MEKSLKYGKNILKNCMKENTRKLQYKIKMRLIRNIKRDSILQSQFGKALKDLLCNKASGLDYIPVELMKIVESM